MHLDVDYLNTDHIGEIAAFIRNLPRTRYKATAGSDTVYQPTYKTDDLNGPAKNIILLIDDGTGLAPLYAGCTANNAELFFPATTSTVPSVLGRDVAYDGAMFWAIPIEKAKEKYQETMTDIYK